MDIVSGNVTSVLDRVFKVDIEYTGLTQNIVFGESNKITDKDIWTNKYTQTHYFDTDAGLKVSVPQPDNGLENSSVTAAGSARVKGIYCLPSAQKVRIKYTFHYYDTALACGNAHAGEHTSDCYEQKTLTLNLPQDVTGVTLLSVLPNHYTLNKGGIRFDRIIDVGANLAFEFNTEWKNDSN